jgi:hypothetical protein
MWVGLFLNSTTPIQLAVPTATVEDLPGVGVETIWLFVIQSALTSAWSAPLCSSDRDSVVGEVAESEGIAA